MNAQKKIFITSFLLTLFIFSLGFLASYGLDFFRINEITKTMLAYQQRTDAYIAEKEFIEVLSSRNGCDALNKKIHELKETIKDVGVKLSKYGERSFFRRYDFDYLKRKYFLLELKLFTLLNDYNSQCGKQYVSIIFFYEIDDDLSERQGYVLDELSRKYSDYVIVLSFDKDYKDEPLLDIFKIRFNVTKAPFLIIDNEKRFEGIVYEAQLKEIISEIINIVDFDFVLNATGTDKKTFINGIRALLEKNISDFARGDVLLVMGRLTNNRSMVCEALKWYSRVDGSREERALACESIASIGCWRNSSEYYMKAADLWFELGNGWRADIDRRLALGKKIRLEFGEYNIKRHPPDVNKDVYKIEIGSSLFPLNKTDLIVSQADRVSRDWLSYKIEQSPFGKEILTLFSERLYWDKEDLLPEIGWHEGGRIKEMIKKAGIRHRIGAGTMIAQKDGKWYSPNENGIFMFEVPIDKVMYPTTRFLRDDLAVVVDTHGVNMLVEQAIRYGADFVVGCCDAVSKVEAAKYLSDRGIKTICFTDKYLPLLLFSNASILGSPPIMNISGKVVVGGSRIRFTVDDKVVVQDVCNYSNVQSYYDTPARYFRQFEEYIDLNADYVCINESGKMDRIIDKAEEHSGRVVIGVRVYNKKDYESVSGWLHESKRHKAVLFHSAPYPWGYRLFYEFPGQVAFDDINPVFP